MQANRRSSAYEGLFGLRLRFVGASFALFALLCVGHLLPALHWALVAHRVCAEHGELQHAELQNAELQNAELQNAERWPGEPRHAAPAPGVRSSEIELVAGQHAGHEHDHCGVLAQPWSPGLPSSASWREMPASARSLTAGEPGELASHAGIALLLYAPKLAPPG